MTITPGTPFTIDATNQAQVKVDKLDSSNVICGYLDGTGNEVNSVVIQSDETVGTAFTHDAANGQGVTVAALSSTKAILVYATTTTNDVRAVILNISGTTITTPGSELSLGFDGSSGQLDIVAVSSSAAILVVRDLTSSNDGVALYLTVSGNTITNESNVTFDSGDIDVPRLAFVSSTKAVVAYNESLGGDAQAAILSVSGTTISTGVAITIDDVADLARGPALAPISTSEVLLAYNNNVDNNIKARTLSISGTTLTQNSAIVVEAVDFRRMSIAAYSATKFALSYQSGLSDIKVAELTVSGTSVTSDTPIAQNSGTGNFLMSSVAFSGLLAINAHKGSLNGILLTLGAQLGLAAMTKPASIDAAGGFIYLALLDSGTPILSKISTALNADGTTVFNPGAGNNIGVECGRFSSDTIWVAGNFDGTNVIEKSEDGGTTFVVKDDATIGDIRTFVMGPDSDLKLLVFDETNGDILETINNGETWTNIDILETINNGETWTNINASVTPEINAIARLGENTQETVFGNDGAANDNLNYSVNSGNNLEDFNLPVNQNVTKVIVN
jgi:hypothetical protein